MPGDSLLTMLNAAAVAVAHADLRSCCASLRWATEVLAQRPFASLTEVEEVSAAVLATLDWSDVLDALADLPGVSAAGGDLARGDAIYRERFGHGFVVCASGMSAGAVLSALRRRLGHDRATERAVVRAELARIVARRLRRLASR
ncbi:2-oxo-4-hydroxy-4-carboxy-5-ureidoimidazoline decarboxylase [Actinokineospora enzanensis]|uniref:2-oxo-4-hydroxy-4-carboxy-5-ureidoimidazoline decarboxylase n=1 Tax=Actinokineospora enzanensis TaxID=155975 RepID=UPI000381E350|nr:2-oxo-4-hydroxy-4-carboxy-5-ureidoimidazoline decarboxylase [Actinokineospora enzanensis]